MKKIFRLLSVLLLSVIVFACGSKKVQVTLDESTIRSVTCAKEDGESYKCTVKSDGVKESPLGANIVAYVYIDGSKQVISKVEFVGYVNESDDYGKALLEGTIKTADGKTFYNKYVNIGEEGLSFSELDKLQYTKTDEIRSVVVVDENDNVKSSKVKIYQPADLATGATGTACSYINVLKAAIETYRSLDK